MDYNHCKFPYRWNLKDADFKKNRGTVFSCFACGGGSTMGYKLAGFDVIGCNEIDPKMMAAYIANHNPKYSFLESIQTFKERNDLPEELYNLDILDGSPPCSSFSISGKREKHWGKEKKFREGQAVQILDNLFFDFIDLAKKLQPKIVVVENVKGLIIGNAKKYLVRINQAFEDAGYYVRHWLLDASKMGVPQKRKRVIFVAIRKDISPPFVKKLLFTYAPNLDLEFNEREIPFKEIADDLDLNLRDDSVSKLWDKVKEGSSFSKAHPKGHWFNEYKCHPDKPMQTITASNRGSWHHSIKRGVNDLEIKLGGTFPLDYNFLSNTVRYIVGMSVPPVMIAQIASRIDEQWLSKM